MMMMLMMIIGAIIMMIMIDDDNLSHHNEDAGADNNKGNLSTKIQTTLILTVPAPGLCATCASKRPSYMTCQVTSPEGTQLPRLKPLNLGDYQKTPPPRRQLRSLS